MPPSEPPTTSPPPAPRTTPIAWPAGVDPTPEWETAVDHVRSGDGHLFITGRAGSGKSTLLRALPDLVAEPMVVVAPTGLAAVNVGGQTIHSFFGLPPRLIGRDDIMIAKSGLERWAKSVFQ